MEQLEFVAWNLLVHVMSYKDYVTMEFEACGSEIGHGNKMFRASLYVLTTSIL